MIKRDLLIVLRYFVKNKVFSLINLLGLALGLTCFTVILLFVEFEFSYDKSHRRSENIYRVVKDFVNNDGARIPDANTPPALSAALRTELPEVESVTRFMANGGRRNLLEYGGKQFFELNLLRIDSSFFQVFDFKFVNGSKDRPFNGIHSIILSETTARKYFGEENPVGKILRTNINNQTDFEVSAVLKDVPSNSHFTFDVLIPFESRRNPDADWNRHTFYTYARLKPTTDPLTFESKVKALVNKHLPHGLDEYYIQSIADIHLTSRLKGELGQNGDLQYVRILFIIGIFVLVIAAINYVNLVTAQSASRAKEIGIKKTIGAYRSLLVRQFLFESLVMVFLASVIALVFTLLLLPFTSQVLGADLTAFIATSQSIRTILPCCILGIAILSGIYPALYLSSFEPLKTLKGKFLSTTSGIQLRQGLVVFQFVMSSVMIIGFLVISEQLEFIHQKHIGFDQQNVLIIPNVIGIENPEAMAGDFRKVSSVVNVGRASGGILGSRNSMNGVADKSGANRVSLNFLRIDYDFIPTLKIQMSEGRNFSAQFPSDSTAIIINKAAVSQLGLHEPVIGQKLMWDDDAGKSHDVTIVGITNDFHFTSFHDLIKPFGFILEVGNGSTFLVKVNSGKLHGTLSALEEVWKKHAPGKPFDYSFQDEQMATLHITEERFQKLFTSFTILAIVISSLGLFGLITAVAESKTKEIGIRKVLGASVSGIVSLLAKEFIKLVAIALIVAVPFGFLITENWLQEFAYRIEIKSSIFIATGVITLTISFLTVSFHSVRAALANPVHSLRNE